MNVVASSSSLCSVWAMTTRPFQSYLQGLVSSALGDGVLIMDCVGRVVNFRSWHPCVHLCGIIMCFSTQGTKTWISHMSAKCIIVEVSAMQHEWSSQISPCLCVKTWHCWNTLRHVTVDVINQLSLCSLSPYTHTHTHTHTHCIYIFMHTYTFDLCSLSFPLTCLCTESFRCSVTGLWSS